MSKLQHIIWSSLINYKKVTKILNFISSVKLRYEENLVVFVKLTPSLNPITEILWDYLPP